MNDTKQRMIESAAGLLQTGGLAAASFTDIVASSGAARGAIYHHFPSGKAELAREAVAWTGLRVQAEFASIPTADPEEIVARFLAMIRPVMSRAVDGVSCAVAAVTVESAPSDRQLLDAAGAALESWVAELEGHFLRGGMDESAAHTIAVLMITFLEGAQVLCRAAGDERPFDTGAAGIILAVREIARSAEK